MQTLEPIIAEHPFFEDLRPDYLGELVGCASNVRFDAGAVIFLEGGDADQFYLIREGTVSLDVYVPNRGVVTIQTIHDGDVLGWSWLFPPYQWHFDARAVESVRALAFDAKCLREKADADHELGYQLMQRFTKVIMERLQATRLQLLDLYGDHTEGGAR